MKRIALASVAAGALIMASAASAEEHHPGGGAAHGASAGGHAPAVHHETMHGPAAGHGPAMGGHTEYHHAAPASHGATMSEHHMEGHGAAMHGAVGYHGGATHYQHDAHGFGMRPDNWNDRPHDFNRGDYQRNFEASRHFHYGDYMRPHGWYYRRWAYGDVLPSFFWARDYWITSWWMFDLPIPPYGYEWVRYGDDALLVNVDNGQILQVEYGVFY